jgi:hypothetical protein
MVIIYHNLMGGFKNEWPIVEASSTTPGTTYFNFGSPGRCVHFDAQIVADKEGGE